MDLNRFTEKMQEALRSAQSRAVRLSHQQLDVEHLLAALLEHESGLAGAILAKAGASAELLGHRLKEELDRLPKVTGSGGGPPDQIHVTGRLNRVLAQAEDEAKKRRTSTFPSSTHCSRLPTTKDQPGSCWRRWESRATS